MSEQGKFEGAAIVERPIIFSGGEVRAILAGTKTQARRVMKPQPEYGPLTVGVYAPTVVDRHGIEQPGPDVFGAHGDAGAWRSPFGEPGDRLWVRETHYVQSAGYVDGSGRLILYRATEPDAPCTWTPSIHMPRWASRITLEVEQVRVQRVQDITEDDARAEGVTLEPCTHPDCGAGSRCAADSYRGQFAVEWNAIYAKRGLGWGTNPWVWAVTFRRLEAQR